MQGFSDKCPLVPEIVICRTKSNEPNEEEHEIPNSRPPESISESLALAAQERSKDPEAEAPAANP